jgi:DNA polymerase I-like protein with 3'-5' exonuclease and polymerase domains
VLEKALKDQGKAGLPIRSWGGREYYTEPPKIIDGHTQTFEYKLLNYLIQGSAADCTKQALINYHALRQRSRFMTTVHDEINISCPKSAVKKEMELLREAMASVAFDVPMLSDGKIGPNWGNLTAYKEK